MIEIYKRNSHTMEATYLEEDGTTIDLSGFTVKFIIKRENDKAENDSFALTNRSFVIGDEGANGSFVLTLTSEDTNIPPARYNFEVQLSNQDELITLYQDKILIKESFINE